MKKYLFLSMVVVGSFCFGQDGCIQEYMQVGNQLKMEHRFEEAREVYHGVAQLNRSGLSRSSQKLVLKARQEERECAEEDEEVPCPGCGRPYIPGSICVCDDVEDIAPVIFLPFDWK